MKRWHEVNEIFQRALEVPLDRRQDYLRISCAEDPGLERAVRSLLAADESAVGFLEDPLVRRDAMPAPPDASEAPALPRGRRIGPYKLLRRVGQGGMSTVYLARREDGFERQVALKLIRQDMESEESERRLRVEREILAHLDHPFIARLYDGGTTEEGLPYFVMEHIEGLRIDLYCDQQQLTLDERLGLFQKILEAVRYAHQNLIVHRDLKPSNILVTAEGDPKLLDFGIAKILNAKFAAADGGEKTATWLRVLTPSYASPEQIRGGPITTSSDVYSLGVLLFKLLTGSLPYHLEGQTPREVERRLSEIDPPLPSATIIEKGEATPASIAHARRTTATELRRRLAGDLDAIVAKALRTAPQRRYGSVEQLSQDLRRYQEGYPVQAGPDSLSYRLAKYLRRHRKAAAVLVLAALLGSLFVGALVTQNIRVGRERDLVRVQRDATARVLGFTERILGLADPAVARGTEWTIAEALGRSDDLIEEELAQEPEIRARLHGTVGRILLALGESEGSVAHLEKALRLEQRVSGISSLETAGALSDLAAAWVAEGDFARGKEMAFQAVELYRAQTGLEDPGSVGAYNTFVHGLCAEGDFEPADAASIEALTLARGLLPKNDPEIARALHNRAQVLNKDGDHEGAQILYGEALAIRRAAFEEPHPLIASTLRNLAATLSKQKKYAEAERYYLLVLDQQRLLLGEDHPDLAPTLNNLAVLLRRAKRWAEAEATFRRAIALFPHDHVQRLRLQTELASLLAMTGKGEASEAMLRRELAYWRPRLPPGNTLIAWAESALGETLIELGRLDEAEPLLTASLPLIRERRGPRDSFTQKAVRRLVRLLEAQGRAAEAEVHRAQLTEP